MLKYCDTGILGKRKERAKHIALAEIPCSYCWFKKGGKHTQKQQIQE